MSETCCWPEQDAVDSWLSKNGVEVTFEQSMELKNSVSKYRISAEQKLTAEREARWKANRMYLEAMRSEGGWIWQGDGSDHLESLSCPIVITPAQLTEIVQRAESAEQRNREAMEQEPRYMVLVDGDFMFTTKSVYDNEDPTARMIVYANPIPPADVADDVARWKEAAADLGRCFDSANKRIAELERNLADQQSQNNFDATRLRRLTAFCGVAAPDSDEELLQVAGMVIGSCLRVLDARVRAMPEGWQAHHIRQYMHNDGSGFVAAYDKDGIDAMLSAAPQPDAAIRAKGN